MGFPAVNDLQIVAGREFPGSGKRELQGLTWLQHTDIEKMFHRLSRLKG